MRTETAIAIVLLLGAAAFVAYRSGAFAGVVGPSVRDQIFALPGKVPQAELDRIARALEPNVGLAQGAITGATTGAVAGPYGIAIGAGAGAVASLFM
jgi:hypothetical protein